MSCDDAGAGDLVRWTLVESIDHVATEVVVRSRRGVWIVWVTQDELVAGRGRLIAGHTAGGGWFAAVRLAGEVSGSLHDPETGIVYEIRPAGGLRATLAPRPGCHECTNFVGSSSFTSNATGLPAVGDGNVELRLAFLLWPQTTLSPEAVSTLFTSVKDELLGDYAIELVWANQRAWESGDAATYTLLKPDVKDPPKKLHQKLEKLICWSDAYVPELHKFREAARADVVCVLADWVGYEGGFAPVLEPANVNDAPALGVLLVNPGKSGSLKHELGHVFGCEHPGNHGAGSTASKQTDRELMRRAAAALAAYDDKTPDKSKACPKVR